MKRIAINGFGRIGRASLKVIQETPGLEVIAINDLMTVDNAAYLLKYDSVYGNYKYGVINAGDHLMVNDKQIAFHHEPDPSNLPWKDLEIDVVIESTGRFTQREKAEKHLYAGAKTVVISGPTKSEGTPTVIFGVNTRDGDTEIFSCGSCTTNNIGPILEIMERRIGVKKAILTTVHAFTASQSLVDSSSKRALRMGRSAAINLAPASTGAAIAVTKAMTGLRGRFDGVAVRTPVAIGSISDITFIASRITSPEEINSILQEESVTDRYSQVLSVSGEPLVSSDIVGSAYAAIVDTDMTRVVDGDLCKVMAWYDNEWGFTNQMIRQILAIKENAGEANPPAKLNSAK